ncbi:hypothetical protein ACQKGI_01950 [Peribacillus muralis]|uniref:hypothetical protein n=1 Tax=Peribacillus muralis TaxID=264697 RepID=UPI00381B5D84
MLSKQRIQLEMITLDQLVSSNHLIRKMEAVIHISFIYHLAKEMYVEAVRPSIDFMS